MRFLVLTLFIFTSFFSSRAQLEVLDQRFSIHHDSIPFAQLIDSLSASFGVSFSYDASLVRGDSVVFAQADNLKLGDWLRTILANDEVELYELDNQIVMAREPARLPKQSILILGSVADGSDKKPLEMVNIGVEGEAIGTVTNDDGRFELLLPPGFVGKNLSFSRLGYFKNIVAIPPRDTTLAIVLDEMVIPLPEVVVRYVKPSIVMQEVVRRRPFNYAAEPTILTAFFREIIQQDDRYVDVSEAVLEIYKPTYLSGLETERVRFVKGRKGGDTQNMKEINFKLQGGPFLFSQVDIIRQGGFLPDEDGGSLYKYAFNGIDFEQGRMVYVIGFEPIQDTGELLYQGEIRIDQSSYAVVGAHFEMSRNTLRKSREYLIRRDSHRFRTRPNYARYTIDYRPVNDLWMLNSVRGEVNIKIVDRERKVRTVFNTVSEMLVTDLRPGGRKKFKWTDSFKFSNILSEEIDHYDSDFWSHYNIIHPSESIRKVFKIEE